MDINMLKEAGLIMPFDEMSQQTIRDLKDILMDGIVSIITGALFISKEECNKINTILLEEPALYQSAWPAKQKTGIEMAGFLNGYCLRYNDWNDTLRVRGISGHPSDQIAALLTLCNCSDVDGKKLLELTYLAYQLWFNLYMKMMYKRQGFDSTTVLGLTVPILAAICHDESLEQIQNALNLSAMGSVILCARPTDITNLKNGATGYAIARSLWCYRMSGVLEAPLSTFTGLKGWYNVVAALDEPLKNISDNELFSSIELRMYPCASVCQGVVECGVSLAEHLADRLEHILRIVIYKSAEDAPYAFKNGQARYPDNQFSADHHIRFCTAVALKYGTLTPRYYTDEIFCDGTIRHLIDLMEYSVFTQEKLRCMGGEDGTSMLQVFMDDGTVHTEVCKKTAGSFKGIDESERVRKLNSFMKRKLGFIETECEVDLSNVRKIVYQLEDYDAKSLLDSIVALVNVNEGEIKD